MTVIVVKYTHHLIETVAECEKLLARAQALHVRPQSLENQRHFVLGELEDLIERLQNMNYRIQ